MEFFVAQHLQSLLGLCQSALVDQQSHEAPQVGLVVGQPGPLGTRVVAGRAGVKEPWNVLDAKQKVAFIEDLIKRGLKEKMRDLLDGL